MEKRLSDVYFVEYEVELEKGNNQVERLKEKKIFIINSDDRLVVGLAKSIIDGHRDKVKDLTIVDIRPL